MGTNYAKGIRYEKEIMAMLRDNGYEVARTAGSHGVFDVVAIKKTAQNTKKMYIAVLIQAKIKLRKPRKKKE